MGGKLGQEPGSGLLRVCASILTGQGAEVGERETEAQGGREGGGTEMGEEQEGGRKGRKKGDVIEMFTISVVKVQGCSMSCSSNSQKIRNFSK